MSDKSISILGCGWLGLPLAQHLIKHGFMVKGSTTTESKLSLLKESKIEPYLLTASDQCQGEGISSFFQSRILFLNIPFRRNLDDPNLYKKQIDAIVLHVAASPIEHVIFASSTSIYPATIKEALEDGPIKPDNPRSEALYGVEQSLSGHQDFQSTIIRFSGLYGGKRKIGRVLAGRTGLIDANSPVNLIHLKDCVEIVTQLIEKDVRGEIINACSDGHPTRKEIYTKASIHYGFEPPQFSDLPATRTKIVSNAKLKKSLGYVFQHPDPMDF